MLRPRLCSRTRCQFLLGSGLGFTEGGIFASISSYSFLPSMMMGKKWAAPGHVWFSL